MSVGRLLRHYLGGKVRPLWWFSNGLEFKHIVALGTRHYLGYPIAYLTTRYDRQWRVVLRNWRRVQGVSRRNDSKVTERGTSANVRRD